MKCDHSISSCSSSTVANNRPLYVPLPVLCRVPECQLKSIVWQTLQAVNFCHKHSVSMKNFGSYHSALSAIFDIHLYLHFQNIINFRFIYTLDCRTHFSQNQHCSLAIAVLNF